MKVYKNYLIIFLIAHFYIETAQVKTKLLVPERNITRKEAFQLLQRELSRTEVTDWELQKKKLETNQNQKLVDLLCTKQTCKENFKNKKLYSDDYDSIDGLIGKFPFKAYSFFGLLQKEQEDGLAYSDFTRRLIISAPSGYGKNYLVKHIAKVTKSRLVKLYRNNIDDCALNKTNLVKAVFDQAIELGEKEGIRTIICIDEITDFARSLDMEEESDRFYAAINAELWSHISKCKNNPYIVVIGIVRDNSRINSYVLKTFTRNIAYLNKPDDETRAKLIDFFSAEKELGLSKNCKLKLASESEGLSIGDIEAAFNFIKSSSRLKKVYEDDFIEAIKDSKKELSEAEDIKVNKKIEGFNKHQKVLFTIFLILILIDLDKIIEKFFDKKNNDKKPDIKKEEQKIINGDLDSIVN